MDRLARLLLETINSVGEMPAKDFLKVIPRKTNDYRDFFLAANLMHAGFFDFDAGTDNYKNPLGETSQKTAIIFAQIMLPEGESFEIDGCDRDSWHDFPVNVFSTAKGLLKLEQILEEEQKLARDSKTKRFDYLMAVLTGVIVAVVASLMFHYFALERTTLTSNFSNSYSIEEIESDDI